MCPKKHYQGGVDASRLNAKSQVQGVEGVQRWERLRVRGWREISGCGSSGRRVSGACRGGGHDHCLPHQYWRPLSDHHQRVRGRVESEKGESHFSGSDSMMTLKTRAGSNLSDCGSALVQKYCM